MSERASKRASKQPNWLGSEWQEPTITRMPMICLTTSAVRSVSLPRYNCSLQRTLPSSLSQLQSALHSALLQPFLALQLSQLLLGSAFGVPSLPLVVIQALILKAFLICIFQGQYSPEFADPAGDIQSFGTVFYDIHKTGEVCRQEIQRQ